MVQFTHTRTHTIIRRNISKGLVVVADFSEIGKVGVCVGIVVLLLEMLVRTELAEESEEHVE